MDGAYDARVELLLKLDEARRRAVDGRSAAWIYVTLDDDGHVVNAAGFWLDEVAAGLAAASDPDEGTHHVAPLFVLNPLSP